MKVLRLTDMKLVEYNKLYLPSEDKLLLEGFAPVYYDSDAPESKPYVFFTEEVYFDNTKKQYRVRYVEYVDINLAKKYKTKEIKDAFTEELSNGHITFTIPSSGITVQVDARRNSANNDLQNVEGLIEYMQLNNVDIIEYKCRDNQKYTMTFNDLQELKKSLINRGVELYAKKHYLEDLVEQAQTEEELNQIKW